MSLDAVAKREADWAVERSACLDRFRCAVRAGRRGDWSLAVALVEHVRSRAGDAMAHIAKLEVVRYARSKHAA